MGSMHHDKEEEEEVTLTTNVKSKEGERRRTAVPPSGRSETPETVLTGLGGDMKKTVLTGLNEENAKTALTGPSDTTMVETPGITPQSSERKVNPAFSAAAAPITPPCTGEAEKNGKSNANNDEEEINNQGDNNVHTMSHDEYLEVIRAMKNMGERVKTANAAEAKQLALMHEAIAAKDAIMAAQAAGWEEQRKNDHYFQMERENETMKMILESRAGNGETKTRYKPTKPAVFKDDSTIRAWQQLKTIETYAIRANLAPCSFMGVLYDHLGPDEQTWLQGIVQTYAWTMESCTETQWIKVKNMFTEKFAGSRIARETAVTGARQMRNERMGAFLTRFRMLSDQAGMGDEAMMVARAVHGIYGSIKGNFAGLAVRTNWASFTAEAEGIYEVLVPRGKLPPLMVGSSGVHAVCEESFDEEDTPAGSTAIASLSVEQLHKALSAMNTQPAEKGRGYGGESVCWRCAKSGHSPRNCPEVTCYACNKKGHMSTVCMNRKTNEGDGKKKGCLMHGANVSHSTEDCEALKVFISQANTNPATNDSENE